MAENQNARQYSAKRAEEMRRNYFKEILRKDEGLRLEPYKPVPTEKYFTIGYGHYGSDVTGMKKITKERAEELLDQDVRKRMKAITRTLPDFYTYPMDLQGAIFSEYFRGSITGSPKTVNLLNKGLFGDAAVEYLDNDEYRDRVKLNKPGIGPRMERVVRFLNKYTAK